MHGSALHDYVLTTRTPSNISQRADIDEVIVWDTELLETTSRTPLLDESLPGTVWAQHQISKPGVRRSS